MSGTVRLLYAEDDPADGDLTRAYLTAHAPDFDIDIVESGAACLARLEQRRYDVLLLDHRLPDYDGPELLAVLAERSAPPIVMVTGVGDEELVVRLLRLGAWDYVAKQGDYLPRLPAVLRAAVVEHRRLGDPAARRQRRRILYVERHAADIDLTTRAFAAAAPHLTVDAVRSTAEALARLEDDRFDLVLIDLRMPELNALDFLRELRHRGRRVPVVVVTGLGDETTAVAALKLGAYDYIVKRDEYLTHLPYAIDNAIHRFELAQVNDRLQVELAERERAEAERLQMAEQLQQAQKIDSLGRLAGGVAHDFNNLLTVIIGQADMMLAELHRGDPLRADLEDIRTAAGRAAALTRQLLAFSRKQLLQPRVIDLNRLIGESSKMLTRLLGEDVELVTVLSPDLGRVRADPGQIDQVIVNLAVNARDAMPQGGRLTIETRNVTVEAAHPDRRAPVAPGAYVMLAIGDTGHAIDPEHLPRIFEPFFTTKEQGTGTGLGLSMVYGIVKQSGGWIWVYSEPHHGTTFKIYLPRIDERADAVEEPPVDEERLRGGETVLVVEDEEAVRKLTGHALRKYGYDVIEAANGSEALLLCERRALPIRLMITDVVMPQMSGPDLSVRLRRVHPEIRVLYTSGYTDDAVVRHGLLDHAVSFLQKPFTPTALARKVREVLDG